MWRHFCPHTFSSQHRNNRLRESGIVENEAVGCDEMVCGQTRKDLRRTTRSNLHGQQEEGYQHGERNGE